MIVENIVEVYFFIAFIFGLTTALCALEGIPPREIDNFYDWLFYSLFWVLILLKYLIKFLFKLFKIIKYNG